MCHQFILCYILLFLVLSHELCNKWLQLLQKQRFNLIHNIKKMVSISLELRARNVCRDIFLIKENPVLQTQQRFFYRKSYLEVTFRSKLDKLCFMFSFQDSVICSHVGLPLRPSRYFHHTSPSFLFPSHCAKFFRKKYFRVGFEFRL